MDRVEYQPLLVQDMINLSDAGELNVSPWYQRRSTWTTPQKAYLINTLLGQKPIPAIYIRYSLDLDEGKTIREVVDGQQRTRAILDYCMDKYAARHPEEKNRKTFSQLSTNQRRGLLLTSLPVGYLLGATDEDVIDIFGRINSVSKTLNAQEKRNSRFSGEFKQFCLNQAASRVNLWRGLNLFSANDISRMLEVQFISDLALNLLVGLSDFRPNDIDAIYDKFDEDFPDREQIAHRFDRVFDFIASLDVIAIKDTVFSRQPIFFSLLIVLDSLGTFNRQGVENGIYEMDARMQQDEENQDEKDLQFMRASLATTQRINQRKTRDAYIRRFLG